MALLPGRQFTQTAPTANFLGSVRSSFFYRFNFTRPQLLLRYNSSFSFKMHTSHPTYKSLTSYLHRPGNSLVRNPSAQSMHKIIFHHTKHVGPTKEKKIKNKNKNERPELLLRISCVPTVAHGRKALHRPHQKNLNLGFTGNTTVSQYNPNLTLCHGISTSCCDSSNGGGDSWIDKWSEPKKQKMPKQPQAVLDYRQIEHVSRLSYANGGGGGGSDNKMVKVVEKLRKYGYITDASGKQNSR